MRGTVTVTQQGREGRITYMEGMNSITGYQEFGGGDVVAIVSMGSVDEWRSRHAWALGHRAQILRCVADEVIRQCAPSCVAAIDETNGGIELRSSAGAGSTTSSTRGNSADASWVLRYGEFKGKLGLMVLALAMAFIAVMWVKARVFG